MALCILWIFSEEIVSLFGLIAAIFVCVQEMGDRHVCSKALIACHCEWMVWMCTETIILSSPLMSEEVLFLDSKDGSTLLA